LLAGVAVLVGQSPATARPIAATSIFCIVSMAANARSD
jgi:hypothetical protein